MNMSNTTYTHCPWMLHIQHLQQEEAWTMEAGTCTAAHAVIQKETYSWSRVLVTPA